MIQRFYASCPKNLEDIVEKEIIEAGGADTRVRPSGVGFSGSVESAYRMCLWSRAASRVFLEIASSGAEAADDVYKAASLIDWSEHLEPDSSFAVEASIVGRRFPDSPDFTALKVKDAIVDFFRDGTGSRPTVDTGSPDIIVHIHVERNEALLSIDLSGGGLHRRGYRTGGGPAPLKENIAAALLIRSRWDTLAREGGPLIDPMCGSGTILIEAAMIAADVAPGLLRKRFGCPAWRRFDSSLWDRLTEEAGDRRAGGADRLPPLFGFDIDGRALETAEKNIENAGFGGHIFLKRTSIDKLENPVPGTEGLIVTNPPYGRRIGSNEGDKLPSIMGSVFKSSFSGWTAAVLSPDEKFETAAGLKADHRNVVYNGQIRCTLYRFDLFTREERDTFKDRADRISSPGAQMFRNRLLKNLKRSTSWRQKEQVRCFRVYDADMPEYALAADVYEDIYGKKRVHVQEYAPPPEIEKEKAAGRLKEACAVLRQELGLEREDLILKVRRRQRGASQYNKLAETAERYTIEENGLRFLVNLTDYLDTGIFLDHRNTRALLRLLARGTSFLNLFAYTGTATVYAAAGGASATTTVDTSQVYLDWAGDNMLANGLRGDRHALVRMDSFEFLRQTREQYGLIFIDPPTFSNSKDRAGTFDIQRDHGRLITLALSRLGEGGVIVFSTNARRFKPSEDLPGRASMEEITHLTLPPDFRRPRSGHRSFLVSADPPGEVMEKKVKNLYDLADALRKR